MLNLRCKSFVSTFIFIGFIVIIFFSFGISFVIEYYLHDDDGKEFNMQTEHLCCLQGNR